MNPPTPLSASSTTSTASQNSQPPDGEQITQVMEGMHLHGSQKANGAALPQKPPRPRMTNPFSRMFSQTGRAAHREIENMKETASDTSTQSKSSSKSAAVVDGSEKATSPKPTPKQQTDKRPEDKKPGREPVQPMKRFDMLPDGNHVHYLKSAKRQEKLSIF
ncbi:hypothetical protein CISG_03835 [Coccidioides immitis RMSCC 3703]|uniref:Uncharacterized protein n=1 Tax=Coccidioides immitis RMSCC 3703 TaxID=454286 RepID=A0A0J8TJH5_COCIT|nr:hypothetical protein CISG_03835 [Coccidioides immitis RMSCC 3703]